MLGVDESPRKACRDEYRSVARGQRKQQVAEVMREVSNLLGNTPTVARKSYVHRRLIDAFENGRLAALVPEMRRRSNLSRGEALIAALFKGD